MIKMIYKNKNPKNWMWRIKSRKKLKLTDNYKLKLINNKLSYNISNYVYCFIAQYSNFKFIISVVCILF